MEARVYDGWRQVPDHLLTATQLKELEFPREPTPKPAAWVNALDWNDKRTELPLYDAHRCPPTKATARALESAAARASRSRICVDCGARCQRPPATDVGDRALCPACRSVVLLRAAQHKTAANRAEAVTRVREWLARSNVAVVQVTITNPGRTPAGRTRPDTAARIAAVDADGRRLVDVLVSLVGPKARIRVPEAVPTKEGAPLVHAALIGRPLIAWGQDELLAMWRALPHPDWPRVRWGWDWSRVAEVRETSTRWRGQLDERRLLVPSLPPGTPDRLLLHLQRIADDVTPAGTEAGEP